MTRYQFPANFIWGTATASYQIEGAHDEDGRGESIWDRFSHTPGKIKDASNGDVACDHYHLWRDDVQLMKSLGVNAYRFSIAWPRVFPEGRGAINPEGVDFYNRLVDQLLENGITPYATLYHWDLPQTLEDQGGWPDRAVTDAFVEYTDVVSRALGDRVKNWITINEPWCVSLLGYFLGGHAPGQRDGAKALRAAHHTLLAHGMAVPVLRRNSPDCEVGITLNYTHSAPATATAEDYHAARIFDGFFNRWFFDPVFGRRYPADMVEHYSQLGFLPNGLDFVHPGDMETIATQTDFLGLNYYTRDVMKGGGEDAFPQSARDAATLPRTEMDWEIYPDGLYSLLCRTHFEYGPSKILITENGAAFADSVAADGKVHDPQRVDYLRDHFAAAHRAMQAGAPVAGYFVWSLMDNFEWGEGYTKRFGIVWTDYETQQRIPKESASFVRDVAAAGGFDA